MSNIAQSRDIADPKTIRDFADIVQSPERLKLLLLLTVADIRAVGPGTWNGWKGQLLRTLYHETEPLVAGGHTQIGRARARRGGAGGLRATRSPTGRAAEVERFIDAPLSRLLAEDRDAQAGRARRACCAAPRREGRKLASQLHHRRLHRHHRADACLAPNHPRLLALFAGACAAAGANIAGAHISTTRDGFALDTFLLRARVRRRRRRAAPRRAASPRRSRSCSRARSRLGAAAGQAARAASAASQAFTVAPEVDRQQRAVRPVHRDRGVGPRPAGPAVRADQRAVGPQPRHHLGPHHHLRREGGRRVLRHRPDRQEDRQPTREKAIRERLGTALAPERATA